MLTISFRRTLLAVSVAGLVALAWCAGGRNRTLVAAQQPSPDLPKATFLGVATCKRCHTVPLATDKPDFVLLTEYGTWQTQDKHSLAYALLEGPRGRQMADLLKTDVTKAEAGCLSCHSMNFPEDRRGENFSIKDGVSCDGCHGPAQHWLAPHFSMKDKWRKMTPAEKEALGMFDVRNPVKRAAMCVSCHVGSPAEGKVVTHAMYAAGHPPLPSFEVASFSKNLPPHWRAVKEVPYLQSAPPEIRTLYHFDTSDSRQTELVTAGGVVALHQAMILIASRADLGGQHIGELLGEAPSSWPPPWLKSPSAVPDRKRLWPELALAARFKLSENPRDRWPELAMAHSDCAACHHDLQSPPSWRQLRGYPGSPGRPPVKSWPLALVNLSTRGDEEAAQYLRRRQSLHAALDLEPFGDPQKVLQAARELAQWSATLVNRADTGLNRDQALTVLAKLSSLPAAEYPDYDSARQIAWAFQAVFEEWFPKDARHSAAAEIRNILKTLEDELGLSSYSGSKGERFRLIMGQAKSLLGKKELTEKEFVDALPGMDNEKLREALLKKEFLQALQEISDRELAAILDKGSQYDPVTFKKRLAELSRLVTAARP